jgi:predicted RNase H-like nuclease (RuvC/YqgF family)
MAAQGVLNARAAALSNPSLGLMRQNLGLYGNQARPQNMGPPPLMNGPPGVLLLEQKVNTQHSELQRLLTENQRLAATHVALRQELAAAQQEVQRMQSMVQGLQTDKEVQVRSLLEKSTNLEAELRAIEPLKTDILQARSDCQKLHQHSQELGQQVWTLTAELQRARADVQLIPTLRNEIETLRSELQRARNAFEFEKKANAEQLDQRQAMEKNLVSMARDVEKLRAELTNAEKQQRLNPGGAGSYNGIFPSSDLSYNALQQQVFGDNYGLHSQIPLAVENGAPFPSGQTPTWGSYDMQRHVSNNHN